MQTLANNHPLPLGAYLDPRHLPRALWRQRELLRQLTAREVAERYRGTYLGVVWSFLTPLLMLAVYTFVFSRVLAVKWGVGDAADNPALFALALFAGLIPFTVFSEAVHRAPSLVLNNPNYVKRVVFPLEVLPLTVLGAALIHSLISVAILVAGIALLLGFVSPTLLLLPLAYLPLVLLCAGLSWFLAALGVYVRDIGQGVTVAVQALLFLSPIFYAVDAVPPAFRPLLLLNPLSPIVNGFRDCLLWQ